MVRRFDRLTATVVAAAEWLTAAMFVVLIVVIGAQVFNRVVRNASVVWAEEVAKILLFYIVFVAGSIAVHRNAFSAIDAWARLTGRPRRLLDVLVASLVAGFQLVALRYGLQMVGLTMSQITPALEIPQAVVYAAVPLGMGLMVIVTVNRLLAVLASGGEGRR